MLLTVTGYYQETGWFTKYLTRQDAREVQQWIDNPSESRLDPESPPPNQRAKQSLAALFKFAENVDTCRHVSICRYFGEEIDTEDAALVRQYCDRMCDVCKYPEKAKRLIRKLSTEVSCRFDASAGGRPVKPPDPGSHGRANTSMGQTSGSRFYGTTKRAAPESDHQALGNGAKKAKVPLAPALVTKPHASTSGLNKPFKNPLMKQVVAPLNRPSPSDDEVEIIECKDVLETGSTKPPHNFDGSSNDSEVPDIVTELEVSFSAKIPMDSRLHGFNAIRKALYRILMSRDSRVWDALGTAPTTTQIREKLICSMAKELEFINLSLSSTTAGYTERMNETSAVISADVEKLLMGKVVDEDEAQDIVDVMRRLCRVHPRV
ncbi:hypothetical protein H0H92_003471 [Tricholoma furcatifolium]|nr:hypothetical protein H0H92_003471 [Tricholoma furcatifolium]